MRWKGDKTMKHFRYILLCLSLIAAVGLMAGCSCGNPQDETSASTPAESGSTGMTESQTQESTREPMSESSSYPADIYETGDGMYDATNGVEDGAGSMGTDEGMESGADTHGGASSQGGSSNGGNTNGSSTNGGNGTGESGGLMEDVTDGLEQIGEDITGAVDDAVDGSRTRR